VGADRAGTKGGAVADALLDVVGKSPSIVHLPGDNTGAGARRSAEAVGARGLP
jgi:hypothetical protein